MSYTHLTAIERYQITYLHMSGISQAQIARQLGRHPGSISRELRRNRNDWGIYHYEVATCRSALRRSRASSRYKLDADTPLSRAVREGLDQHWSPQQIVGRLRLTHARSQSMRISHEAIYQWIYRRSRLGEPWYARLRRRRARRRSRTVGQRGQIRNRVGIEHRPASIESRRRFGDWEGDTVEGAKGSGALLTCVERKSRFLCAGKLNDQRAASITRRAIRLLADLPGPLRRTMTLDNGKEFADFATLEQKLKMTIYFADPHSPWQRGTNENTNGLLREFFPKGCDMQQVTHQQVAKAMRMLNNRPRQILNYRTPAEVLSKIPGVALQN